MSYDLTIRSDETYSKATAREPLDQFLLQLACVEPNGKSGFALDDPPERRMECGFRNAKWREDEGRGSKIARGRLAARRS
jgi:hypothetical protein